MTTKKLALECWRVSPSTLDLNRKICSRRLTPAARRRYFIRHDFCHAYSRFHSVPVGADGFPYHYDMYMRRIATD